MDDCVIQHVGAHCAYNTYVQYTHKRIFEPNDIGSDSGSMSQFALKQTLDPREKISLYKVENLSLRRPVLSRLIVYCEYCILAFVSYAVHYYVLEA